MSHMPTTDQPGGSAVPDTRTITAGTGLSGGGALTADRTVSLANTSVTPGSYTATNLTVDAQGRITAASNGSGGGGITNGAGANVIMLSDGTNAVASSISDDGTTVSTASDIAQTKTSATSWVLTTRSTPSTYPVPVFQPITADTIQTLDIMPKGTPTIGVGGYSWIDVCDTDFVGTPAASGHSVRLGVGLGSHANLDSQAFNGATALPLALSVGGTNVLLCASNLVTCSQNLQINPPTSNACTISGNMASGCISAISNVSAATNAYAKITASNDGSTGEICLFAFGTGYTTNGALRQDTGVVYSGAGMSGGMNLCAAAAAPIRFYAGGIAAGNLTMQINSGSPGTLDVFGRVLAPYYAQGTESLTTSSAASIALGVTFVSGTGSNLTLADGTDDGQTKTIVVTSGTGQITPANFGPGTKYTWGAAGQSCTLVWGTASGKWWPTSNLGMTLV